MKTALIVDDDHLVRSYLKILPSWERAGFRIAAGARDGEEALALLEKSPVDLLVTDISMPLLDGIELIRRVRRTDQHIYIIALSCHDEFAYVKDAMKEGADDYVLKHTLNEDSLYQLLQSAAQRMEEQQRQQAERTHIQRLAKAGDQQLKYAYFSKVTGEALEEGEREQERRRAGLQRPYRSCGAISIRLESWEGEAGSVSHPGRRRYCQEFLRRLPDALGELLDNAGRLEIVYWGKGQYYGFLDLSDLRDGSAMQQALTEAALACARVCGWECYPFGVGVSEPCMGPDAIRSAYRQVNQLMKRRFYERQEVLFYDPGRKTGVRVPAEAEKLLAGMDAYRRKMEPESLLNACLDAARSFERNLTDERLVLQWLAELELKAGLTPGEDVKGLVSMEQVRQRLREDVQRLDWSREDDLPEGVGRTVSAAAEFVRNHYKEPIGLTETAQAVGVNPTYLSYLFHREAGVGFSNFLLNLRIARARTLLRETNLKVREVAEQAGFHDYHYFAKAFKKLNGQSPAVYRKQTNLH